jgi:hypothetical protein
MGKSLTETKAKLMAQFEAVVDKALAQAQHEERLTITGIEEIALQARAAVGEGMTAALVEHIGEARVPGPRCGGCGREMLYKGQKKRYVRTRSGDVDMERGYYYCPSCRGGLFPPG